MRETLKKMELTWGSAENEGKDRNSWPKEMAALSSRQKETWKAKNDPEKNH